MLPLKLDRKLIQPQKLWQEFVYWKLQDEKARLLFSIKSNRGRKFLQCFDERQLRNVAKDLWRYCWSSPNPRVLTHNLEYDEYRFRLEITIKKDEDQTTEVHMNLKLI